MLEQDDEAIGEPPPGPLKRGWTTGTCAAAAARAAYEALLTGTCPAIVEVSLPGGQRPAFAIATFESTPGAATAGVVKDAGDDPDVTHGALVKATVRNGAKGSGVTFRAGEGVGSVTKPGLPLPPGEPAINPVPRTMIRAAVDEAARHYGGSGDVIVEISIPDGEALAQEDAQRRGSASSAASPSSARRGSSSPTRARRGYIRSTAASMSRARPGLPTLPGPRDRLPKQPSRSSTTCPRRLSSTWATSSAAC